MIGQSSSINKAGLLPENMGNCEDRGPGVDISLIDVLTQLGHRKWLVAKITGILIVVGAVLCLVLPVRYTSTTRIMPPQQAQSAASLLISQLANTGAGSLAAMAGGGLGLKNPNDIYVGLIESRPIADTIIQKFSLMSVYHSKDMTAARKKLAKRTLITSEKNGFIEVAVTDGDKKRATAMANAYTEELRTLTNTLAISEASRRRLFYEEQLKQAKETLITAELSFQQVQQNKGLVQLDAQARAMIQSLAALRAQVAAKQVELEGLRSFSTESNPQVELVKRELTSLQGEVSRLEQRSHSSGFGDLGLQDLPGASLEYLRTEHEVRYRQALFDLLIKQYDVAKLDEAKDAAVIQVLEPAIEPDRKSSPQRLVIMLLFSIGGPLVGCLLALLQWQNERVKSNPDHVRRLQGLKDAFVKPGTP